ncbi:MAG TPA: hypothetical protein VG406_06565 [Isosphaeraceae bacterium]|jgi:hypothetical protein|nr:hypothetical protein [Isosphaeraceae bacterium]
MTRPLILSLLLLVPVATARGQGSDAALRDRVARLVEKLEAEKAEARDAAEKTLVELGPKALPYVPEPVKGDAADKKTRLDRVRKALREAAEQINLGASKVTIQVQGIRLSDAVKKLQALSGNAITDERDEPSNPTFDLDLKDKPFLEALDEVARKGGVGLDFFSGDGSIGLKDGPGMQQQQQAPNTAPATPNPFRAFTGPFLVTLKSLRTTRDFEGGNTFAVLQLEADWEPRLRPMLLALKNEDVKIVDDRGKEVKANLDQESMSAALNPDNPAAEININFALPDRDAKKLASVKVKAELSVPAALRTFRFPNLAKADVTQKQGNASVTLESCEVDEQTWKVDVAVKLPGAEGTESYQMGSVRNRLWLQKPDGSRFELNGGFNQTGNDGGTLSFEYLFVDVPGKPADYQLVYETPSKIVTIPLEFEFKDVPLP